MGPPFLTCTVVYSVCILVVCILVVCILVVLYTKRYVSTSTSGSLYCKNRYSQHSLLASKPQSLPSRRRIKLRSGLR